jgi:EAL and modified HD-GYP domain-containing signal transduction protein
MIGFSRSNQGTDFADLSAQGNGSAKKAQRDGKRGLFNHSSLGIGNIIMEVYVARQPIFGKDKEIYGYELLFRDSMSNFFPDIDGDTASSKILSNSFLTIGIEQLTGKKVAFINFTQDLLLKQIPLLFPRDRLVVEILEDVEPNEEVINACRDISEKGYELALDDFFYRSNSVPLIALAHVVKIDFRATPLEEVKDYVNKLSTYNVNLLAEKVETYKEFEQATELGFEYFQGYFFSKPEIISGKGISTPAMNLLEIVAEANKEDFEFSRLEQVIQRDVTIAYKLLRYINSAFFRRVCEISSIKQAIVLLGWKGLRSFLSLITMADLAENKPGELIRTSIMRSKFCELIGGLNGSHANQPELFTLGLFSLIDAILDDTMENLMEKLPLSSRIKDPLLHGRGELVDYLKMAVSYEKGDWEGVRKYSEILHLDEAKLPGCFLEAIAWADALSAL